MSTTKVLSPEHFEGIEIKDPDVAEPDPEVYEQIAGMTSVSKTEDAETTDVADWDNDGHGEDLVTQRSVSYSIEGFKILDPETGESQRGQEILEEAARKVGYGSRVEVRVVMLGGKYEEFTANVDLGDQGGGVTDPSSFGVTLSATGWPEKGTEE